MAYLRGKAKLNLVEADGERHSDHWHVMIRGTAYLICPQ